MCWAEPLDLKIAWRDHSGAYLDFNLPVTDAMVSDLLRQIADGLGAEVSESEIEQTVWRLELAP